MRIKHWQGYGSVNATKMSVRKVKDIFENSFVKLEILVYGNHEWGIETTDKYRIFEWLVKRFYKKDINYSDIDEIHTNDYYKKKDGLDVEHCYYTIYIKC